MKTIKCQECGEEIPLTSIVCPKCNARCLSIKHKKMAVIFAFCLGLFGVHNYYLGFLSRGCVELACTGLSAMLIFCGIINHDTVFIILGAVTCFIVLCACITEAILMCTKVINRDAKGKRLGW